MDLVSRAYQDGYNCHGSALPNSVRYPTFVPTIKCHAIQIGSFIPMEVDSFKLNPIEENWLNFRVFKNIFKFNIICWKILVSHQKFLWLKCFLIQIFKFLHLLMKDVFFVVSLINYWSLKHTTEMHEMMKYTLKKLSEKFMT